MPENEAQKPGMGLAQVIVRMVALKQALAQQNDARYSEVENLTDEWIDSARKIEKDLFGESP